MPPRRSSSKNANTWNTNSRNTNTTYPVPDQEVLNAEFKSVIQMFAQCVVGKNNQGVQAHMNGKQWIDSSKGRDFVRMNLPEFLEAQTNEDPQNFLDNQEDI